MMALCRSITSLSQKFQFVPHPVIEIYQLLPFSFTPTPVKITVISCKWRKVQQKFPIFDTKLNKKKLITARDAHNFSMFLMKSCNKVIQTNQKKYREQLNPNRETIHK